MTMVERLCVRILVAIALCTALIAFLAVQVPVAEDGSSALPAIALGQADLYRLEVALLVFHGILLLVTPAFSGLARGRLPIEISIRGTKFADETERLTKRDEIAIQALEQRLDKLTDQMELIAIEIKRPKDRGDKR